MRKPRYFPADPQLAAYDHGLGTLTSDGELRGYLASYLGGALPLDPRPWFVVVWNDGTKEKPFDDHGPSWRTVRELDAGYLNHHEQGTRTEGRVLGFRTVTATRGAACRFDFEWLPADAAAQKWTQLGLADSDF